MSLKVLRPGVQSTVQAGPRHGLRHQGVPHSGAADALSLALANRLVGNPLAAPGVEMSLSGAEFLAEAPTTLAVTGADSEVRVNGQFAGMHRVLELERGDALDVGAAIGGARSYLAVAGGIDVPEALGSASTYLPAGIGGFAGRALCEGDELHCLDGPDGPPAGETPREFRPRFGEVVTLRAVHGREFGLLDETSRSELYSEGYTVSPRNDRMGLALDGRRLGVRSAGRLDSRPVFPGTVQCPEGGELFLLGADCQTSGGYPRVAEVIRCDRFLIGQLRRGSRVRFLVRDPDTARADYLAVLAFWRGWLTEPETVI